jgi:hypothetical protein
MKSILLNSFAILRIVSRHGEAFSFKKSSFIESSWLWFFGILNNKTIFHDSADQSYLNCCLRPRNDIVVWKTARSFVYTRINPCSPGLEPALELGLEPEPWRGERMRRPVLVPSSLGNGWCDTVKGSGKQLVNCVFAEPGCLESCDSRLDDSWHKQQGHSSLATQGRSLGSSARWFQATRRLWRDSNADSSTKWSHRVDRLYSSGRPVSPVSATVHRRVCQQDSFARTDSLVSSKQCRQDIQRYRFQCTNPRRPQKDQRYLAVHVDSHAV